MNELGMIELSCVRCACVYQVYRPSLDECEFPLCSDHRVSATCPRCGQNDIDCGCDADERNFYGELS